MQLVLSLIRWSPVIVGVLSAPLGKKTEYFRDFASDVEAQKWLMFYHISTLPSRITLYQAQANLFGLVPPSTRTVHLCYLPLSRS